MLIHLFNSRVCSRSTLISFLLSLCLCGRHCWLYTIFTLHCVSLRFCNLFCLLLLWKILYWLYTIFYMTLCQRLILYSADRCHLSVQPISGRRFFRCAHCTRRSVLALFWLNLALTYILLQTSESVLAIFEWYVDLEQLMSIRKLPWQGDDWPWVVSVWSVSVSWQGVNWPWVLFYRELCRLRNELKRTRGDHPNGYVPLSSKRLRRWRHLRYI